jgi:hypothetical protein
MRRVYAYLALKLNGRIAYTRWCNEMRRKITHRCDLHFIHVWWECFSSMFSRFQVPITDRIDHKLTFGTINIRSSRGYNILTCFFDVIQCMDDLVAHRKPFVGVFLEVACFLYNLESRTSHLRTDTNDDFRSS